MRNFIPSTFVWVLLAISAAAQVPNGDFEIWMTDTIYDMYPPFNTSNAFSYISQGQPNVYTIAGCEGNGVRLETISNGQDTAQGYMILGETNGGLGGGIPFTGQPDSLSLCLRYDIQPNDTAFIILIFKNLGVPTGISGISLTGKDTIMAERKFPISPPMSPPDSLLILISSSNLDSLQIPGSYLELDNIGFTGTNDTIPNGDFENLESVFHESPAHWEGANALLAALGQSPGLTKSQDAFTGSFAARIETKFLFFGPQPDTFGLITNGVFGAGGPLGFGNGQPYMGPANPGNIAGYYKYEPVGNDTAVGGYFFTRFNAITMQAEQVAARFVALPPTQGYRYFEMEADISGLPNPDSLLLIFAASDQDSTVSTGQAGIGSTLFLDGLGYGLVNDIDDELFANFQLYPNPASDWVEITLPDKSIWNISLRDLQGRRIKTESGIRGGEHLSWDLGQLPSGTYIVEFLEQGNPRSLFKKLVVRH